MAWYQDTDLIEYFTYSFIKDELRKRARQPQGISLTNLEGSLYQERGMGFDSLDLLSLATGFCKALGIDKTDIGDLLLVDPSFDGWVDVAKRSLAIYSKEICFYSSGTQAAPKFMSHSSQRLLEEVQFFQRLLTDIKRVVTLVPGHHIYGFIWGGLMPSVSKVPRLYLEAEQILPSSLIKALRGGDLLVATPDTYQLLQKMGLNLPAGVVAVTSTSPCPQPVSDYHRFSSSTKTAENRLLEIYGSTETAAIGYRDTADSPYRLLPYWQFLSEQKTAVSDQETNPVWLKRETVANSSGGQKDTELSDDNNAFRLADKISLLAGGGFIVQGRLDDVIQIGGRNISPGAVRARLKENPTIADASVKATQTSDDRPRLKFFITPANQEEPIDSWLETFKLWMAKCLPQEWHPDSVVIGENIPRSGLNKLISWNENEYNQIAPGFYHTTIH